MFAGGVKLIICRAVCEFASAISIEVITWNVFAVALVKVSMLFYSCSINLLKFLFYWTILTDISFSSFSSFSFGLNICCSRYTFYDVLISFTLQKFLYLFLGTFSNSFSDIFHRHFFHRALLVAHRSSRSKSSPIDKFSQSIEFSSAPPSCFYSTWSRFLSR